MKRLIEVRGLTDRDVDAFLEEVADVIEEMELTYAAEAQTRARVSAEIDAELKALAAAPRQPSAERQPTLF